MTRSAKAGKNLSVARLTSATVAGFLLVLAGCGIPKLRPPQPGPMLPDIFLRASNQAAPDVLPPAPGAVPVPSPGSDDKTKPEDGGTKPDDQKPPAPEDGGTKPDDQKPPGPDGESPSDAGNGDGPIQQTSYFAPATSAFDAEFGNLDNEVAAAPEGDRPQPVPIPIDSKDDMPQPVWIPIDSKDDMTQPDAKAAGSDNAMQDADSDAKAGSDNKMQDPDSDAKAGGGIYGDMTKPDSKTAEPDYDSTEWDVEANGQDNSSCLSWFQFFNDPTLLGLVDQALAGNQELKILTEEIFIASNEIQARRGAYLPFVNIGGRSKVEKTSRFTRLGAVEDELEVAPGKSFSEPIPDFLVAADLSWQVDIWRMLRNARDAAAFRYLASQDGQNYIITRLVAEVAENYYELLALDSRLKTLDQTIAIQQQSLKVAELKKAAARGTELAVQRFLAEVRKNQSEKLVIQQEIVQTENRINFLLGRYPQAVERPSVEFIDLTLPSLNVGVPMQLLQNRPDIRQAERELAAAGLDIQVARARFYPTLEITGLLGHQSQDWNPKFFFQTPEALVFDLAGHLVAPLINKQAIKADYKTANAKQLQAVYHYQRTVLNAYTEVMNRMNKVQNYGKSIEVKKRQLKALVASVDAATKLFQNARVDYVDVLLAQREMMEARMILIATKRQQLSAVINTYQALGGGGRPPGAPGPIGRNGPIGPNGCIIDPNCLDK